MGFNSGFKGLNIEHQKAIYKITSNVYSKRIARTRWVSFVYDSLETLGGCTCNRSRNGEVGNNGGHHNHRDRDNQ